MYLAYPGTRSRRAMIGGGLAALAGTAILPRPTSARRILSRGISGGGMVRIESEGGPVLVYLSLFASALILSEENTAFIGRLQWVEAGSGLVIDAPEITQCIATGTLPGQREVRGFAKVNGGGRYPFVITVVDIGEPGSATDTIELDVNGPAARSTGAEATGPDFSYQATATVAGGDFAVLSFDLDTPD